ncbi:MAG: hypothetical protein UF734_02170 [Clostridium sp.]|nr:hypothetical protein [Clostridium sp.]
MRELRILFFHAFDKGCETVANAFAACCLLNAIECIVIVSCAQCFHRDKLLNHLHIEWRNIITHAVVRYGLVIPVDIRQSFTEILTRPA